MAYRNWNYDPDRTLDTGWGLIMRLNYLWSRADQVSIAGDLESLNFVLDRIFCNLLYREPLEVNKDSEGNIIDVQLSEKDKQIWQQLNKRVNDARQSLRIAKQVKEYQKARADLYQALMMKDIGLRKFMFELKIYLKEADRNPARAMWGG